MLCTGYNCEKKTSCRHYLEGGIGDDISKCSSGGTRFNPQTGQYEAWEEGWCSPRNNHVMYLAVERRKSSCPYNQDCVSEKFICEHIEQSSTHANTLYCDLLGPKEN